MYTPSTCRAITLAIPFAIISSRLFTNSTISACRQYAYVVFAQHTPIVYSPPLCDTSLAFSNVDALFSHSERMYSDTTVAIAACDTWLGGSAMHSGVVDLTRRGERHALVVLPHTVVLGGENFKLFPRHRRNLRLTPIGFNEFLPKPRDAGHVSHPFGPLGARPR